MVDSKIGRDELIAALRDLDDRDRAVVYAESIPAAKTEPISLDDLKTMSPQQIVDAHQAGRLDHLPGEQAARNQARREARAERARNRLTP